VVVVALLARTIEALLDPFVFNDGPRFVKMAAALLAGDWRRALSDDFHPLTPLAMAAGKWLFGLDLEIAGEAVNVLAGGVAALAIWKLALDQFGSRAALVAGFIFALHPRLRESSAGVQSDGIHLACFVLGALFAWRALERRQLASAALAGLCTALAYLTRPEGLAVAVVLAGWLLWDLARRRVPLGRTLALGAAFGIALVALSGPYVFAMHEIGGRWSLTHKKDFIGWGPRTPPAAAASVVPAPEALPPPPALDPAPAPPPPEIAPAPLVEEFEPPAPPETPPRGAFREMLRDGQRGFHPILLVLAALGLGVILRSEPNGRRGAAYALSFFALFLGLLLTLHLLAGYVSRRHFLPAAALLVPLAGRGTLVLSDALERIPRLKAWRALPALGVAIMLGILIEMLVPQGEPSKRAREGAALWLREHRAPTAVASHRARDAYYAGAAHHIALEPLDPRAGGFDTMLRSARARGAQFAILDVEPRSERALPAWAHVLHQETGGGAEVLVLQLGP
jgi:4-amino-4-deoxy-L-arabinose transferase-like glycosyltransferase